MLRRTSRCRRGTRFLMIKSSLSPSGLSTIEFYDTHAKEYCESTVHLDLRGVYERFLGELGPGAHILDAGCGSGRDTKAFLDKDYCVTAIDASPEVARLARTFTGQPCGVLRFQDMEFREEFDGIWACASLLHVPRDEMPDVMSRFIQALKPAGILYLSLKEGDGERIAADGRFFSNYSTSSFRGLLVTFPVLREVAFWKTEEIRSPGQRQPWLNFLLKKVK
jgi:SAM-dependent methyltransferase